MNSRGCFSRFFKIVCVVGKTIEFPSPEWSAAEEAEQGKCSWWQKDFYLAAPLFLRRFLLSSE